MPIGSPEDYEAARGAEMADVELDYEGRGKLDVHAAAQHILQAADRFAAVMEDQPGLPEEMTDRAASVEASQRRREFLHGVTHKAGSLVVNALVWAGSYSLVYDKDDNPIPIPWAFPF